MTDMTIRTATSATGRFSVFAMIRKALDTVYEWQRRSSQRHYLADIDERLLSDIGMTRAQVSREINKRFYQA